MAKKDSKKKEQPKSEVKKETASLIKNPDEQSVLKAPVKFVRDNPVDG